MIVTIDGTAGSGKSTTAKLVAQKLGYKYIDSGATYRALAFSVKKNKIDPKDENKITKLSKKIRIDFQEERVFLNGEDITERIRDEEISKFASFCSIYKRVRENMVTLQRKLADRKDVVCEGRDIGTVVFPDAEVKIYMDASIEERAKRRTKELIKSGIHKNIIDVERNIKERDLQDKNRIHSPLCVPREAKIIDTTNLSIEEEVEKVIEIITNSTCEVKVSDSEG